MAGRFKRAAGNIQDTPMVIPIFIAFVALMVIGIVAFREDYETSKLGYAALPTRKTSTVTIAWVALLPQIITITIGYLAIDKNSKWALMVTLAAMTWDTYTDIVFKASGMGAGVWVTAIVESLIVYTLGSEVAVTVASGMLIELFPKFLHQATTIFSGVSKALDNVMGDGETGQSPQVQRTGQQRGQQHNQGQQRNQGSSRN